MQFFGHWINWSNCHMVILQYLPASCIPDNSFALERVCVGQMHYDLNSPHGRPHNGIATMYAYMHANKAEAWDD